MPGLGFEERRYQHLSPVQTRTRHPPGLQMYIKTEQKNAKSKSSLQFSLSELPHTPEPALWTCSLLPFCFLSLGLSESRHLHRSLGIPAPDRSSSRTAREIVGIPGMRRGTAPGALFPRKSPMCRVRPLHLFLLLPNT